MSSFGSAHGGASAVWESRLVVCRRKRCCNIAGRVKRGGGGKTELLSLLLRIPKHWHASYGLHRLNAPTRETYLLWHGYCCTTDGSLAHAKYKVGIREQS